MKRIIWITCACLIAISINATAQHDAGRNAVRFLAKGEFDKTLEALEKEGKISNSPLNMSEKWFNGYGL